MFSGKATRAGGLDRRFARSPCQSLDMTMHHLPRRVVMERGSGALPTSRGQVINTRASEGWVYWNFQD